MFYQHFYLARDLKISSSFFEDFITHAVSYLKPFISIEDQLNEDPLKIVVSHLQGSALLN